MIKIKMMMKIEMKINQKRKLKILQLKRLMRIAKKIK